MMLILADHLTLGGLRAFATQSVGDAAAPPPAREPAKRARRGLLECRWLRRAGRLSAIWRNTSRGFDRIEVI